ncbi:hypothetical protein HK104_009544 [Borealophlyctis nickersoniae]|nr:hypothetical protein HK104_009544 [Borealophlyctis nickersoniae]
MGLGNIAIAGAGAGAVNSFVAGPIELLKIQLQAQYDHSKPAVGGVPKKTQGPVDLAKRLVAEHGWRHGLFRGTWATVVREVPAYAGFYAGFEYAKRILALPSADSTPAPLTVSRLMVAGAFGGVCYWTASYPLDVAKSRIQNLPPSQASGSVLQALKAVYGEAGLRGLFKGYTTSVVRSVPAADTKMTLSLD